MFVYQRFELNKKTIEQLKQLEDPFKDNPFGEIVFYRTYSRTKENKKQETWLDVVIRVINGTFSIRKDWYIKNHIDWDEDYWQNYASGMSIAMFKMYWLPPGRGLWTMGTDFIYEEGSMALNNCGFVELSDDLAEDLCWMIDALMLGVGVGFEPIRNDDFKVYLPKGYFDYVIPDSREGWVNSIRLLINAFIKPNQKEPRFDYSPIRSAGNPIKRFGGISSGPEPLVLYHDQIRYFFYRYYNWKNGIDDYYDIIMLKTDLANTGGHMVVSGNVRRCLPKFAKIMTKFGYREIGSLTTNDQVLTLNGYKRIINVYKQGKQKLVSIWLSNKRQFKCTPNHKIAVLDDIEGGMIWKEAKDLNPGDTLLLAREACKGKEYDPLKAYFYGALNGDGNINDRRKNGVGATMSFACSNNETGRAIANKITEYIHTLGLDTHDSFPNDSVNNFHLKIYNTAFALQCLPYKIPHQCPVIPDEIYTACPEARAAYLAGIMDTDGIANKYNICSSKWILFLIQVQKIATSLGIDTRIDTRPDRVLKKTGKTYANENMLIIKGFASKKLAAILLNPHACDKLPTTLHKYKWDHTIPFQMAEEGLDKGIITQEQYSILTTDTITESNIGQNPSHKRLIDFYPSFWSKVLPIQVDEIIDYDEIEETYDIEVEEEHSFFAEGLLVHNSAELCKGKITDKTFLNLKQYQNPLFAYREAWGGMSNNAAALEKLSDFDHLGEIAKRVIYNAEPGIMNLQNFPLARIGKRDFKKFKLKKDPGKGGNPCTSKKSLIFTRLKNGETKILLFELLKEGDLIWSETGWTKVLRIWSTGIKPVYRYHTTAGYVDLTEDHKIISYGSKIQVKEASCIDTLVGPYEKFNQEDMNSQAILSGLLIADGTVKDKKIYLIIGENDKDIITDPTIEELINKKSYKKGSYNIYETYQEHLTINDLPYTYYRKIPNEYFSGNKSLVISFLRGLYSGNGSICGNRVTLKATSKKLINQVQIMLSSIGIRSYITTNKPTEIEFDNGNYTCKQSYDLNISSDKWKFYESIGFIQNYKMIKLKELIETKCTTKGKSTYDIIEKEYLGEEEVYDCTVDNLTHTFWLNGLNVSNCVEQILENYELCTLADTLPTKCPNNNIWLESCEYASVYVQTVTLLPTHQSRTNKVMSKNRRVGVGLMDFVGWKHKFSTHEITRLLRLGYKIIWKTLKQLAEESGVPEAIRFSTVKPNGSTAKVAKVRSGAGYSNFKYMIRRIRIQQNTSFYNILCKANIPHEPDLFSANTEVFEYPFSLNDDTKSAEEVTLWEQAMNLVLLQREWSNNSVSNTLMFKPKWLLRRIVDGKNECQQYIDLLKDIHIELPLDNCPPEIVDQQTKLKLWYNDKNIVIKIEEYNYNPRHEEDDIEPVLSAIVPLIKTCSLSPHTPKGVYKQMPEEGITKEEYERRVAEIKPIDWNSFVNNDVNIETDKYCTGDKCEII